jgi:putative endonuclease
MYTIYVLKSLKDNNLYIGCTSNLEKRLLTHNKGAVRSTKQRRPFKLIFKEEYQNKYQAFNKEKYYKTVKGKRELKAKIIQCRVV